MLLKVEDGQDGNDNGKATLKNMHVPHFPEMALFETALDMPTTEHEGRVRVTYHPPPPSSSTADGETESRPREVKYLEIPLEPNVDSLSRFTVTMHQSPTTGYDMGPVYNDWFSACFGYPVVLAYLGVNTRGVLGTLAPAKAKLNGKKKGGRWHEVLLRGLESVGGGGPLLLEKLLVPICAVAICASGVLYAAGQLDGSIANGVSSVSKMATLVGIVGLALVLVGGFVIYMGGKGLFVAGYEDRITFADCAPFLVISETSVDNVSGRLPVGEEMDRTKFRPNIVISGAEAAFEEDFWTELVVGSKRARLLLTGNCVRCQSLNVDYRTGRMGAGESGTVLKKLMKDRRVDRGARFSPVFGRYSFLDRGFDGEEVRVGDVVEVVARGAERSVLGESCFSWSLGSSSSYSWNWVHGGSWLTVFLLDWPGLTN
jgi:glycine hydroxymethyltransferase